MAISGHLNLRFGATSGQFLALLWQFFNKPEVTLGTVIGYANKNNCRQVLNLPKNSFAIVKQAKTIW